MLGFRIGPGTAFVAARRVVGLILQDVGRADEWTDVCSMHRTHVVDVRTASGRSVSGVEGPWLMGACFRPSSS